MILTYSLISRICTQASLSKTEKTAVPVILTLFLFPSAVMTPSFLIILIFITALANLFNLSFRLPNLENVDEIGGAVLGFVKGIVYCVLLCWLLSFLGLVIGKKTLDGTTLARFFLTFRFITDGLM